MKKIILTSLLLCSSILMANEEDTFLLKLNSQELVMKEDNSINDTIFYTIDKSLAIENHKDIKSCIIEGNNKKELKKIYCTLNNLNSYYAEIEGKVSPDNKGYIFSIFHKLKNLNTEIEKYKKGD